MNYNLCFYYNLCFRIIQSPATSLEKNLESCISVSMSPIVDVTYSRTQAEEKCFDVLIQDIRINLSVPFLMHLGRYFLDSLPSEQIEKGIINHGYDNNNQTVNTNLFRYNQFIKIFSKY